MHSNNKSATRLGSTILSAVERIDAWSPTTCPIAELADQVNKLEAVTEIVAAAHHRLPYLRGVLAARVVEQARSLP